MNERTVAAFLRREGYDEAEIEDRLWDLAEESVERNRDAELEENYVQSGL